MLVSLEADFTNSITPVLCAEIAAVAECKSTSGHCKAFKEIDFISLFLGIDCHVDLVIKKNHSLAVL